MFEQLPVFEEKHEEEEKEEATQFSGHSNEEEEEVIVHQKRKEGGGAWENVVDEPDNRLVVPKTARNFEEAKPFMAESPKKKLKASPYAPDPISEYTPYDELYEKEPIFMIYHDRRCGGHNISKEDLELLSKKEQEWNTEIADAESVLKYFKDNGSSEEKELAWEESFGKNPRLFLQEDNLEKIKDVSQEERIFMLAKASRFICNSPKDFSEYAKVFPEDVEKIKALFINDYMPRDTDVTIDLDSLTSEGVYQDELAVAFKIKEDALDEDLRKKLFSLSALEIDKIDPELKDLFVSFDCFSEIAQKRDIAKEKIPEDFSESADSFFKEYPEASEDFLKILNDKELSRKRNLKKEDILSEKYEELDAEDKSRISRKFMEYTQYAMIFKETFNRPDLKEDYIQKENSWNIKNRYGSGENFNPLRHSFLYPTEYEPVAFGEDTESKHSKDIEEYLDYNPHYKISKIILEEFKNIKSKEEKDQNTKTIVDFWNKNRSPLLLKNTCDSLSSQNPSLAASELYDLIKKERGDKDSLLAALYRLELGTMGISEKGMDYLGEKKFDLGETYNKEIFSAERVTATGAIGIFNEEKELIKYFYLQGLNSEDIEIKANLIDITLETLHMQRPDDTEEDILRKRESLEELKKNYYKIANDEIFKETGVKLNNLSFRQQGSFALYFNKASEEEKKDLRKFVGEYKEDGIKTFLSLEAGDEMGERILAIGKRLDPTVAKATFEIYSSITDYIDIIEEKIAEIFENRKDISDEERNKISENLLQRADQMLIDFSMDINNQEMDEDSLNKKILEGLENYRGDLMLTASMFRTLIKEEKRTDIRIEDFKNIRFQKSTAQELSVNGKLMEFVNKENLTGLNKQEIDNLNRIREMIKIYEENYRDKPEIRDGIVGGLKNILKEGRTDTEIYTLLQDNKVMAFCRFDENDTLYFGSFNVDDILKSSAIGTSFLRACLEEQEKKQKTIEADCIFKSAIGECYIDKVGFSASQVYLMGKEILLKIEKEPNEKSVYKKMTKEEVVSSYEQNFRENQHEESSPAIILCFDPSSEEMISKASKLVNEKKYHITRYFSSVKNDKSVAYLAFEKTA